MRMLALAQAWFDAHPVGHARVVFAANSIPAALVDRIGEEGIHAWKLEATPGSVDDARELLKLLRAERSRPDWIVADGYFFSLEFQQTLKADGLALMVMDDNGECGRYDCSMILNQNIMANREMYAHRNQDAAMLLGTRFALLRREFRRFEPFPVRSCAATARNIIITLGGSDTCSMVQSILDGLDHLDGHFNVRCIMGAMSVGSSTLNAIGSQSRHSVEVFANVRDMTPHMKWADLSINAAGSTTWEMCAMGVPMVLLVMAENQREIAVQLNRMGCVVNAGTWCDEAVKNIVSAVLSLMADPVARTAMASRARTLVDGRGALRVINEMKGFSAGGKVADSGRRGAKRANSI